MDMMNMSLSHFFFESFFQSSIVCLHHNHALSSVYPRKELEHSRFVALVYATARLLCARGIGGNLLEATFREVKYGI